MTSSTQRTRLANRRQATPEIRIALTHDQIAKLAYEMWERRGRPTGQSVQNWLEAEAELRRTVGLGR